MPVLAFGGDKTSKVKEILAGKVGQERRSASIAERNFRGMASKRTVFFNNKSSAQSHARMPVDSGIQDQIILSGRVSQEGAATTASSWIKFWRETDTLAKSVDRLVQGYMPITSCRTKTTQSCVKTTKTESRYVSRVIGTPTQSNLRHQQTGLIQGKPHRVMPVVILSQANSESCRKVQRLASEPTGELALNVHGVKSPFLGDYPTRRARRTSTATGFVAENIGLCSNEPMAVILATNAPPERDDIVCSASKDAEVRIKSRTITHRVDTPFMSNIGRDTASNTYFEWQTDALASADTANFAVEGADAGNADFDPTLRVANYTQISTKVISVSGTADATNNAGMRTVMAYQTAKKAKELKRDMEAIITSNQAGAAGSGTSTARKTAGLPTWLITNSQANGATVSAMSGAGGNGYPSTAWTNLSTATDVAFTETMLKTAIQEVWTEGGDPKILMVNAYNKTVVSAFAGLAEQRITYNRATPLKIIATADIYLGDFGEVSIVPNRFSPGNFAFVLDPEYASVSYLRPFRTYDIAKTGDSDKKEMVVEYGLRIKSEKAHAVVANLIAS